MARNITFVCDNCGKLVTRKRGTLSFARHQHHFCNMKCYNEYRRKHGLKINRKETLQAKLKRLAKLRMEVRLNVKD